MTDSAPQAPWRGDRYAESSAHHRAADDWFLRRHPPSAHDVIVDLGCGSGEFTAALAGLARHGRVIGIDSDRSMLAAAARLPSMPNLSFTHADAAAVNQVVPPRSVDAVVSRAMLHWLPAERHPLLYEAVFDVLRPGGMFHLEAAGPGNIPRIIDLLADLAERHGVPAPPPFPDPARAFELLEATGFEMTDGSVGTRATRRRFSYDELAGLVRTQAVLVLTRYVGPEQAEVITAEALAHLHRLRRHDGSHDQTFVRLEILVRRP